MDSVRAVHVPGYCQQACGALTQRSRFHLQYSMPLRSRAVSRHDDPCLYCERSLQMSERSSMPLTMTKPLLDRGNDHTHPHSESISMGCTAMSKIRRESLQHGRTVIQRCQSPRSVVLVHRTTS
jgi:hypothetical protein